MHPHGTVAPPALPECISVLGCAAVVQMFRQLRKWVILGLNRNTAALHRAAALQGGVFIYAGCHLKLLYEEFCHKIGIRIS